MNSGYACLNDFTLITVSGPVNVSRFLFLPFFWNPLAKHRDFCKEYLEKYQL